MLDTVHHQPHLDSIDRMPSCVGMIRIIPFVFAIVCLFVTTTNALACSDLPNICAANQAHHREMQDIAATPPQDGGYEEEGGSYDPGPSSAPNPFAAPNVSGMVSGMSGMLNTVAQNYDALIADPRRPAFLNGQWIFPGSELKNKPKNLPCSALYMRKGVGVLLLGPPPGEQMASMIFFGPAIPRPASNTKIEVTLKQSDGSVQTTNVLNMPFDADFGALLFAVPTMPLLVDNMLDTETFQITQGNTPLAELAWTGGLTAKEKLSQCMAER